MPIYKMLSDVSSCYCFRLIHNNGHVAVIIVDCIAFQPRQLYTFKTDQIEFNNTYQVRIVGVNTKDNAEGTPATYNFIAPTCHKFYESNLTLCRMLF